MFIYLRIYVIYLRNLRFITVYSVLCEYTERNGDETCLLHDWDRRCSAWDVRVINRPQTRFNRHAWLEWDYGRL